MPISALVRTDEVGKTETQLMVSRMPSSSSLLASVCVASTFLLACSGNGDSSPAPAPDTGTIDTSVVDTAVPDTGSTDTKADTKADSKTDSAADTKTDAPADTPKGDCVTGTIQEEACGKCGTRSRLCDAAKWLPYGICGGEKGSCILGEKRTATCGRCGKREDVCNDTCEFDLGVCTGEGVCALGDSEAAFGACPKPREVKTRTCSPTCTWGEFGGCGQPKGWDDVAASTLEARSNHTAVWSGTEMLVWGGVGSSIVYGNGAAYNPATNTWATLPTLSAPLGRQQHTSVWTGKAMIVWGGIDTSSTVPSATALRADGALYEPGKGWTALPTAPIGGRYRHMAGWTGTEMVVFGGSSSSSAALSDGAAYNPTTNAWRKIKDTTLTGRWSAAVVASGGRLFFFGGQTNSSSYASDGAFYNPTTDAWAALPSPALDGRSLLIGINTGAAGDLATFFGGGTGSSGFGFNNGATYDPTTSTWKAIPALSESILLDAERFGSVGWYAAGKFYMWGGYSPDFFGVVPGGAVFDVATSTWTALPTSGAPSSRLNATVVWTGSEAVIWGGGTSASSPTSGVKNDGKIFRP